MLGDSFGMLRDSSETILGLADFFSPSSILFHGISCALPNDALRVCQEYEILDDSHEMSFLFGISLYNTTKTLISLIFDFQL